MESKPEEKPELKLTIQEDFTNVLSQLNGLKSYCSSVISQVKALEKSVKKQMKQYKREIKKQETKKSKKRVSGFAIPTNVSNTLSSFYGINRRTTSSKNRGN
jgi:capsule polysaccharide export protein KpsE/RkpR